MPLATCYAAVRRHLVFMLAIALGASLFSTPPASAALGKDDMKCVAKMTKQVRTVAKAQNKEAWRAPVFDFVSLVSGFPLPNRSK